MDQALPAANGRVSRPARFLRCNPFSTKKGIECGFTPTDYFLLARTPAHVQWARDEAARLQELGYDAAFLEPHRVSATTAPTLGALWEQQARLDPYRLVAGLKAAVLRRGVRIFENSEVTELQDGADAQAITREGKVTARKAVIAMNAFSTRFGMADSYGLPVQMFSLATRPLPDAVADKIGPRKGWSTCDMGNSPAERRFFQRFLPDGRFLFGGGIGVVPNAEQMFQPRPSQETIEVITTELVRRYPVLTPADVDLWWGGSICRPVGERPIIGTLPGASSLLISLVCNGKGVAVGSSAGRLIVESISPGSTRDADVAAFLEYSAPRKDAFSMLQGAMFKMLRKGPARAALNLFLKKPG